MKIIVNVETGEVIERELTAEELEQNALDQAKIEAEQNALIAKAAEKTALLERLGISENETKLLLS